MPLVTFILADGSRRLIDAASGNNAMQEAQFNGIRGIVGACGGHCACATCHVYVESGHPLPAADAEEESKLKITAAPRNRKKSRLACRIVVTEALDGLVLRVPDRQ